MALLTTGKRHVFICGLHRSGTTILNRLISGSPEASGFDHTNAHMGEGQYLQDVFEIAKAFGGVGQFAFHPDAYMDEHHPLCTLKNAKRLNQQWSRHWDPEKSIYIEKTPANLIRSRFLNEIFDNSTFIFIIRHPIPVTLASRKWSKNSLEQLVRHWLRAHETAFNDLPALSDRMVLSYEHLVRQPEACIEHIADHLKISIPYNDSLKDSNDRYFEQWRCLQRQPWNFFRIKKIFRRYETRVVRFGYSLHNLNRYPDPEAALKLSECE